MQRIFDRQVLAERPYAPHDSGQSPYATLLLMCVMMAGIGISVRLGHKGAVIRAAASGSHSQGTPFSRMKGNAGRWPGGHG